MTPVHDIYTCQVSIVCSSASAGFVVNSLGAELADLMLKSVTALVLLVQFSLCWNNSLVCNEKNAQSGPQQ